MHEEANSNAGTVSAVSQEVKTSPVESQTKMANKIVHAFVFLKIEKGTDHPEKL